MGRASRTKGVRRAWRTLAGQAAARPLRVLGTIDTRYPELAGRHREVLAERRRQGVTWPRWCYCPSLVAGAPALQTYWGTPLPGAVIGCELPLVTTLEAWRQGKGVYLPDPDLLAALGQTDLDERIPAEVILRLPEWAVYVRAPLPVEPPLVGFFAALDLDFESGTPLLLVVPDRGTPLRIHESVFCAIVVELAALTVREAADRILTHRDAPGPTVSASDYYFARVLSAALPFILYLCSDEPDLREIALPAQAGAGVAGSRVWEAGARIGAAIRAATSPHAGSVGGAARHAPRVHLRRAHWHHYWTGPRAGERRLELRWIPPVPVGRDLAAGPAVVHRSAT